MNSIQIIETGLANIASMEAAISRLGLSSERTRDPDVVVSANRVVLPGVGSFGAAMPFLNQSGLAASLKDRIDEGKPTLAICLGMQLLAEESEEAAGVKGLGCIEGKVIQLPKEKQVPQLGWNVVTASPDSLFLESGYAYFANSFCLPTPPSGWDCAETTYGIPMVSAMERGDVLACQFHPELSGQWGSALLSRWAKGGSTRC